ncbi:triacylglycerol lipase 2-like [Vicia villosa]|uniref:triacylglycerol lipase 2-like n=1 Tax=Vicia villosa TaxID=3911 RepID=UPI00273BC7E2|nr:triacylglycerol lipase 2-like [Vicia villosa]
MANNVEISLISILLICITAAAHERKSFSNGFSALSQVNGDGICKTLVETQGYKCEEHTVITNDGYILSLQRIPTGRSGKKADKPPVLLQHGLLCKFNSYTIFQDAVVWMLNSPEESLGFILADNGFDVWLVNGRGTKYSTGHTSLTPNDAAYWEWTWDELAGYDLPASVEYVFNHTGQKLHYAGHSQGTLVALVNLSQGKLLNMLRSAALLSPIAHMNHVASQITKLAAQLFLANDVYWLGLREFIPYSRELTKRVDGICSTLKLSCGDIISLITGPNCCVNASRVHLFFQHELHPTSTKNMIHLSQMIRTGQIAKYDYRFLNTLHYRQMVPPTYDMTKIPKDFPLFISYGGKDYLSDVQDVKVLLNDLSNHDATNLVVLYKDEYAHLDFVAALDAKQVVYDPMIAFYNNL